MRGDCTQVSVMLYPRDLRALEDYRYRHGFTTLSRAVRSLIIAAPNGLVIGPAASDVAGISVSVSLCPSTRERLGTLQVAYQANRSAVMRAIIRSLCASMGSSPAAVAA